MGAGMLLKVTCTPASAVGSGPTMLAAATTPATCGARPLPRIVSTSPGETVPGAVPRDAKLAPLTKERFVGPGLREVSVKVVESEPTLAVTTIGPAGDPAETPTEAVPSAAVVAVAAPREAGPLVTAKLTVTPGSGLLLLSRTLTTTGCANTVLIGAVWPEPETA